MVSAHHVAMEGLHSIFVSSYLHATTLNNFLFRKKTKAALLFKEWYSSSLASSIITTWRIFDIGTLAGNFPAHFFFFFN